MELAVAKRSTPRSGSLIRGLQATLTVNLDERAELTWSSF